MRIAERWLGEPNHPIQTAILERVNDPSWGVRRQLAASIGAMNAEKRDAAVVAVLDRYATDPVVMDAALSGLRGREQAVLQRIVNAGPEQSPQREAAITMLAATLVRAAQDAAIQDLFALTAGDRQPQWQRSAALRGAEVALLGAPMPSSPVA